MAGCLTQPITERTKTERIARRLAICINSITSGRQNSPCLTKSTAFLQTVLWCWPMCSNFAREWQGSFTYDILLVAARMWIYLCGAVVHKFLRKPVNIVHKNVCIYIVEADIHLDKAYIRSYVGFCLCAKSSGFSIIIHVNNRTSYADYAGYWQWSNFVWNAFGWLIVYIRCIVIIVNNGNSNIMRKFPHLHFRIGGQRYNRFGCGKHSITAIELNLLSSIIMAGQANVYIQLRILQKGIRIVRFWKRRDILQNLFIVLSILIRFELIS